MYPHPNPVSLPFILATTCCLDLKFGNVSSALLISSPLITFGILLGLDLWFSSLELWFFFFSRILFCVDGSSFSLSLIFYRLVTFYRTPDIMSSTLLGHIIFLELGNCSKVLLQNLVM